MKPFTLVGFSTLIIVILFAAAAFIRKKNEVPEKHIEVVLRDLGHRLLLSANDSSSRVLPIKKLNESTYQISFQHKLSFISDTLINLVQRTFEKKVLGNDFFVSLKNCEQQETVFAFEINSKAGDLTPCRGRQMEVGCYSIEIELLKKTGFNYSLLLLLLIPLVVLGFFKKKKPQEEAGNASIYEKKEFTQLGKFQFYNDEKVLKNDTKYITLTDKEARALKIFTDNINQVIARETLMKELWEDEGIVVISRNVDVLVSKLRKKLVDDESIKFINVHGRGYKLVIE